MGIIIERIDINGIIDYNIVYIIIEMGEYEMHKKSVVKNKYFLYATEFFAGMSVMAVELGASRLMAPYFSSSQIVWTVIIGTIMIAMALGNILGGRMADKNADPSRLYMRLLVASVWIAAIPFAGRYVITGISLVLAIFVNHNFLVWASFATCFVIFVFPLVLLGTVTPSLVKFTVTDLEGNGKIVGELGALNTIGSIIGTFIPTFLTIPAVGTAATFEIFACILATISILYFVSVKKKFRKCLIAVLLIVSFCLLNVNYSFAFWQTDILKEDESIYNYLLVKEDEESISLSTNVLFGVQSIMMKNDELTGMYYDYALAAPVMAGINNKENSNMLVLGMGTGTYATLCDKYFEHVNIEGVEIDQKIANLASEYFELPEGIDVTVYDGRAYLDRAGMYDVIMVDAYQDITIPFQMSTVEFFAKVKAHLKTGGVMVVNMNMRTDEEGSINDYLCDTMGSVFENVYTVTVSGGSNCEVFATDSDKLASEFISNTNMLKDEKLKAMMKKVEKEYVLRESGNLILTDDKAPVELLGMKVLDEMIGSELQYYRELYLGK